MTGSVEWVYLVLDWEDIECSPKTVGVFTSLHMAMEAARLCTLQLAARPWEYQPPQCGEVLRLYRNDHLVIVEAVRLTPAVDHVVKQVQP